MEDGRQSHSSMPLVSRLDHLDFIMKYLEGKQNLPKWGSNNVVRGEYMPLDLAIRETYFKGTLLDRVASLEHRLFQLCLELESSSTSCTSTGTSGETSYSQGSKGEQPCLLPIFNNPNQGHKEESQAYVSRSEIQEISHRIQQRKKYSSPRKQQSGKNRPNKDEKTSKSGKKRVPPNWPHLKLLGC